MNYWHNPNIQRMVKYSAYRHAKHDFYRNSDSDVGGGTMIHLIIITAIVFYILYLAS